MEFRNAVLDNGLEIVAEDNSKAHSLGLGFFVKTGSRDETDETAGVSHFLEHMVFKGTPTRTADDVNREFDEMGAHYNAYTSEESTVYHAAVLPEYQERTLALLADIMRPSLREEDFNTEKQVIVEEIHMYHDQPPFCLDETCKAAHFGSHPLGRSVLGTVESVTNLTVDAMHDYFRLRYSPQNVMLAAAGKMDFDALVESAEKYCGSWESWQTDRTIEAPPPHSSFECLTNPHATQEYAVQLSAAPGATDDERFAAKVLTVILGDDSGSRLYWELIDPGLAEHVSLGHYDYQGAGLFMTYLSSAPEAVAECLQRILDVYRKAENDGFEQAELEQAKCKISSRIVLGSERPRNRLFIVGGNWNHRREYRTVKDDLDSIAAVTTEALETVLMKYPLTMSTTFVIGPKGDVVAPK